VRAIAARHPPQFWLRLSRSSSLKGVGLAAAKHSGRCEWLRGVWHCTHKREQVAFRVVEMIHPQLVSGHTGDEVRFVFKFYARRFKTLESDLDVANLKIQK
jgi:hypothetical protein